MLINPVKRLRGEITVPADKSISHRSVMFGSIAEGKTQVKNCLLSADCLSTISCFRQLGISIDVDDKTASVTMAGNGLHGLKAPSGILNTGNSGTTTRLISGILSGQDFESTLSGDASLNTRPMKRIIKPLSLMGADISSINKNYCAPLSIKPSKLKGIDYVSPIASAQVKSCIFLAGLYADGITKVTEPALSRDHSERMLSAFGANVSSEGNSVSIEPEPKLIAQEIEVPGDISSAAYFIVAALISKDAELLIKNVGINPSRAGLLTVCEKMGADITKINERLVSGEPVCDLLVRSSQLKGCVIEGDIIPALIDEIPMIAVMAAFAEGTTIIKDAADLKAKETDRIMTSCTNLKAMKADITPTEDGMIINGTGHLKAAKLDSYLDHRIAMAMTVAAMNAEGSSEIKNAECVDISYPSFYQDMASLVEK
jgi:3-phosphoshikimate 1-carboxyvinyltransferase